MYLYNYPRSKGGVVQHYTKRRTEQMKKNCKKGFTIVELVVVIVVIAILAAVLIPTVSSLIDKANQSADIQAVKQMNTALAIDGVVTPTSIVGFYGVLEEAGFSAKNYKPLYSDRCFYWVKSLNCVIYYDLNTKEIVYPSGVTETNGWFALDGSFDTSSAAISALPTPDAGNKYTFAVASAADFVKAAELTSANENTVSGKTIEIVLSGDIDLQGADVCFTAEKFTNVVIKSNDGTVRTITGLYVSDEHAHEGNTSSGTSGGKTYGHSLFNKVHDLTVENIKIVDSAIGGYGTSQGGFFAGKCSGNATFTNVTIENCAVQAQKKVGTLIGFMASDGNSITSLSMTNVAITNCTVSTLQGEAGIVFGVYTDLNKISSSTSPITVNGLTITGSTVSVYSNSIVTKTVSDTDYTLVEYQEDGKTEYRIATAQIGFTGISQSKDANPTIEIIAGDKVMVYTAIDSIEALSNVKGTK